MSELADAVGRAVVDAAGVSGDTLGMDHHLALVSASARAEDGARALLQRAVSGARASGASWAVIGGELRMSRQAAQQRFGGAAASADSDVSDQETSSVPEERWLGPVTAFDEMAELDLAGRVGWRTVEVGMFTHRMIRTPTQWAHRRILWRASLATERAEGWIVGCRAFPWIYLVRDLGVPAES